MVSKSIGELDLNQVPVDSAAPPVDVDSDFSQINSSIDNIVFVAIDTTPSALADVSDSQE